jgi:hypothetical protein
MKLGWVAYIAGGSLDIEVLCPWMKDKTLTRPETAGQYTEKKRC